MSSIHPRLRVWLEIAGLMAELGDAGAKQAGRLLRPRRSGNYKTLRPGPDTPLWNACAELLRRELKPHGSKVRLARYLGIPKQRVSDYLKNGSRMPDAETLLRMLNWLAHKHADSDISL